MSPRIARLAGMGALAAAAGLVLVFVLFALITRPGDYAGMDATTRMLSWIGIAGVLLALVGVHVLIGRRLLALARGERPAP